MKIINLFLPVLLVLSVGFALPVNAQTRDQRTVDRDFTGVSVSSGVDLVLEQGSPAEIIVEADEADLEDVKTELKGDVLNIEKEGGMFNLFQNRSSVTVFVTMPEIKKLSASGGADIKSKGEITSDELDVSSSGGADIEIGIQAQKVVLKSSGGADIIASGSTEHLETSASGGSDIKARNLKAEFVSASSSGGANIEVYASEELKASASGGSDVDCFGPARMVEKS
ncbi:MAG: head GIN domain-containing protein, partial [Marinilabilia sp.]